MAPRGPADDGKRFSSDGRCILIASRREDPREGVQGEGGARDLPRPEAGGLREAIETLVSSWTLVIGALAIPGGFIR